MKLEAILGDITLVKVDAIVNAANSSLMGGGGVDGAIHRAGGKQILEECKEIVANQGECPPGEAVITSGGKLLSKYVIHTVGPVWHGGQMEEEEKLGSCYINSLKLAVENDCKTIAFPNIGTGVYRFPKDKAAVIAIETTRQFLSEHVGIEKVIFVCFDGENFNLVKKELTKGNL